MPRIYFVLNLVSKAAPQLHKARFIFQPSGGLLNFELHLFAIAIYRRCHEGLLTGS